MIPLCFRWYAITCYSHHQDAQADDGLKQIPSQSPTEIGDAAELVAPKEEDVCIFPSCKVEDFEADESHSDESAAKRFKC